jgi:uncharacterized protein YbaR (Trm112 family)
MNEQLLELLACPICKGPLQFRRETTELVCHADRLVFAVLDGVPILLSAEGRPLVSDEPTVFARPDQAAS